MQYCMARYVRLTPQRFCVVPNRVIKRLSSTTSSGSSKNVLQELTSRGLISNTTGTLQNVIDHLNTPRTVYVGIDPTADSLHLGNFVPVMVLGHFHRCGHKPVALVGGATGMIGDPSGKSLERNLLSAETVQHNTNAIKELVSKILSQINPSIPFQVVNNYEWYENMSMISYLRDIGKHFRVNNMLAKESVKSRLDTHEGISYTEFSYQLLQAYDFFHLCKNMNCTIQIGGSDQWGNITEGCYLISKLLQNSVYGVTMPLLTTSTGQKIGKSESNATIWLSESKTSVYDFYQYFVRVNDVDVIKFLKWFTFLSTEEIDQIEVQHMAKPEERYAQKILAEKATELIHGKEATERARATAEALFAEGNVELTWATISVALREAPQTEIARSVFINSQILDIAHAIKISTSKAELRRLIEGGGLYFNNRKITQKDYKMTSEDIIEGKFCLFRTGKKNYKIVKIV